MTGGPEGAPPPRTGTGQGTPDRPGAPDTPAALGTAQDGPPHPDGDTPRP